MGSDGYTPSSRLHSLYVPESEVQRVRCVMWAEPDVGGARCGRDTFSNKNEPRCVSTVSDPPLPESDTHLGSGQVSQTNIAH